MKIDEVSMFERRVKSANRTLNGIQIVRLFKKNQIKNPDKIIPRHFVHYFKAKIENERILKLIFNLVNKIDRTFAGGM